MRVYFDHAATTPLCKEAIEEMTSLMENHYGNPSSSHSHGRMAKGIMEMSRKSIAKNLNCSPQEIYFTSGGTEADNMTLTCAVKEGVKNILTCQSEHKAVLHTAQDLEKRGLVKVHYIKLTTNGHVDTVHLDDLLSGLDNCLVSLMHANNEIGNMIDLEEVGAICQKNNALFHSDTVQTVGQYKIDLSLGMVDFISASAHKFNGPKGVGFIYIKSGIRFCPLIIGGGQERNLRGGTENILGIAAMAAALEVNMKINDIKRVYIKDLKDYFISQLQENIEGIIFNGDYLGKSNYKVLSVSFPKTEASSMLLFNLDIRGISCSGGSACSSGASAPSHVMAAINANIELPTIRFSLGGNNTKDEIDYTIDQLKELFLSNTIKTTHV
jgi:cysteine desulfurase